MTEREVIAITVVKYMPEDMTQGQILIIIVKIEMGMNGPTS